MSITDGDRIQSYKQGLKGSLYRNDLIKIIIYLRASRFNGYVCTCKFFSTLDHWTKCSQSLDLADFVQTSTSFSQISFVGKKKFIRGRFGLFIGYYQVDISKNKYLFGQINVMNIIYIYKRMLC